MEILLADEEPSITGREVMLWPVDRAVSTKNIRHTSNYQTQLGLGRYIYAVGSSFL